MVPTELSQKFNSLLCDSEAITERPLVKHELVRCIVADFDMPE